MATEKDFDDPRFLDRLSVLVGVTLRAMAPQQQHLAQSFGVSEGRVSQMVRDWPEARRYLLRIAQAHAHDKVEAGVLAILPFAFHIAEEYRGLDAEALRAEEVRVSIDEEEANAAANIAERAAVAGMPSPDLLVRQLRHVGAESRWLAINVQRALAAQGLKA